MSASTSLRRLTLAALALCLGVVVLGAYVRLTAAGLGCPDWPGCYGHFTPAQAAEAGAPLDLGKAWREMAHRYAAAILGLVILAIAFVAVRTPKPRPVGVRFALLLVATVIVQGALGMLTVTWQLKPLVVTAHLVLGVTTLALLTWLYLGSKPRAVRPLPLAPSADVASRRARRLIVVALFALALQIALGGWTSSNYAAVACPDFPTCQGAWWPPTDYGDAFVLWRGLGINYEGGVLEHPARVAIHFTHRLGAIVAAVALLAAVAAVFTASRLAHARAAALAVLGALVLQLGIGIGMVREAFPLSLATAHNAGAALLVLAGVVLYYRSRQSA